MLIRIDTREQDLLSSINKLISTTSTFSDLKISVETLSIGDIIITDETDNTDKIIIERKSVADLLASIKDGRYKEQSYRLNGTNHPNHNIMYLIEGDVSRTNLKFKDNRAMLYSAMVSLNYYKGFSVMRTFSLEETAFFICNTVKKICKSDELPFYHKQPIQQTIDTQDATNTNPDENEPSDKDYVSVIKMVKKDNITPDNIGEIMLCQIPGISAVTAIAIMSKFKTLPNLLDCLKADSNCLKDITYTNAKEQCRRINKNSTANIVKFLINNNNDSITTLI
jgi:ERCC4-type nuclease